MKEYYYCEDTDKYIVYDDGFYSLEENGDLKLNRYYDGILIGDVWAERISEEEFYAQLDKCRKNCIQGS